MSNITEILVLVDRSGSMMSIIDEAVGAVNSFIEEQRKLDSDDEAFITIASFDDRYEVLFDRIPVEKVPKIEVEQVKPRGMTALNDSIGKLVNSQHHQDHKTVLMIMTDGHENASQEFSTSDIKSLIESKEKSGWDVNFIGAGLRKEEVDFMSKERGFTKSASFDKSVRGMKEYQTYMNVTTSQYRTS